MKMFLTNADVLVYNDKNVSKTFKKLLNTQRMISSRRNMEAKPNASQTKASRRKALKGYDANQVINRDIEMKYKRKLGTLPIT